MRGILSGYILSAPPSRTLRVMRTIIDNAPVVLDIVEMSLNLVVCARQVMKECDPTDIYCVGWFGFKILCVHIYNFCKKFWDMAKQSFISSVASSFVKEGGGTSWRDFSKYLLESWRTVERFISTFFPLPHLILKAMAQVLDILIKFNTKTLYEAIEQLIGSMNLSKNYETLVGEKSYNKDTVVKVVKDTRVLFELSASLFGGILFKDAFLYLERYRRKLYNADERVSMYIWAAFAVRIFCRKDGNLCNSTKVLLSMPGFWTLIATNSERLKKLVRNAKAADEGCFDFHQVGLKDEL